MEKTQKPNFTLAGLMLDRKTTNENNQSSEDCGNLWQKFENEKIFDLIPHKIGNEVYAVYFDYEKDASQPFSYFIGCKVDENADIPKNLDTLNVPAQTYSKLTAKGVMTGCITEAWKKIWDSDLPRKFGFDFEIYGERSRDWNDAELDIFVSIRD